MLVNESVKKIIVLYKKINKEPELIKIENNTEEFQKLVGEKIQVIPYEDILIICNEENQRLNKTPNIMIDFQSVAGNLFIVGDDFENGSFKGLNKEQVVNCFNWLNRISVNYSHIDENGNYVSSNLKNKSKPNEIQGQRKFNSNIRLVETKGENESVKILKNKQETNNLYNNFEKRNNLILEREFSDTSKKEIKDTEYLKMILGIQSVILKYVKKHMNDENIDEE